MPYCLKGLWVLVCDSWRLRACVRRTLLDRRWTKESRTDDQRRLRSGDDLLLR